MAERLDKVAELEPKERGALTEGQWVVLRYADAMTRSVKVEEGLFEEVKGLGLDSKEIVELTTTVASYNMVSRFLVALNVGEQVSLIFRFPGEGWVMVEVLTWCRMTRARMSILLRIRSEEINVCVKRAFDNSLFPSCPLSVSCVAKVCRIHRSRKDISSLERMPKPSPQDFVRPARMIPAWTMHPSAVDPFTSRPNLL